jgi:hypothetical protein
MRKKGEKSRGIFFIYNSRKNKIKGIIILEIKIPMKNKNSFLKKY